MRVILAGGGTGGHIFPALSLASAFRARDPEAEILFIGTEHGLESRVVPEHGFKVAFIPVRGLKRKSLKDTLYGLLLLPLALFSSLLKIIRFKPDLVIGVGGYSSGPVLLAAYLLGKKIALQEQNSVAGVTNRIVSRLAGRIFIHFPQAALTLRRSSLITGNPIRQELLSDFNRAVKSQEGLTLLILGGSQGAREINQLMAEALPFLTSLRTRLRFIHQSGKLESAPLRQAYDQNGMTATLFDFSNKMGELYKQADLVIARAGAMTISELAALGRPSILIPLATAADNHQEMNARYLEQNGAGRLLLSREATGENLARLIRDIAERSTDLEAMAAAAASLGRPQAASVIVNECLAYVSGVKK